MLHCTVPAAKTPGPDSSLTTWFRSSATPPLHSSGSCNANPWSTATQTMPGWSPSPRHSFKMEVRTPACVPQFCAESTDKKLPESTQDTSPCSGVLVGVDVTDVVPVVVAVDAGLSQSSKVPLENRVTASFSHSTVSLHAPTATFTYPPLLHSSCGRAGAVGPRNSATIAFNSPTVSPAQLPASWSASLSPSVAVHVNACSAPPSSSSPSPLPRLHATSRSDSAAACVAQMSPSSDEATMNP